MIDWSIPVAREINRILVPGGASVIMGGSHSTAAWEVAAERAGMKWAAEMTVLWNTGKPRNRNFGSLTTTVRWHTKVGNRYTFNSGSKKSIYSNVIVATKVPLDDRHHPAQKPVELTNFFVTLMTDPGNVVLDPFMGSGSTIVSAEMCERAWMGNDMDQRHVNTARKRVGSIELEENELRPLYLWVNGKLHKVEE